MGLDIGLSTDIREIYRKEYEKNPGIDYFHQHSLSRTFCNFMCRQFSSRSEPELDQIGRITGVDVSIFYQMERYEHDENSRTNLQGNIDKVFSTLSSLIDKLASIHNLHQLLDHGGYDTLGYADYFTDFNVDKGEGYIGNNFGQDLRNFKRFLEFAKERGATTVYFDYG